MSNNFNYFTTLKLKYRTILLSGLTFFFIGLIYVVNQTPLYEVSIIIDQADEEAKGASTNSFVSMALGQANSNASKFYYQVEEAIFSLRVTKKYEENYDGLNFFYGRFFNKQSGQYSPIWNLSNRLKFIKFKMIGTNYSPVPNTYLLNKFIKQSISVTYDEFADLIYIQSLTSSPEKIGYMIDNLIKETDDYFKLQESSQINERISFLTEELSKISSISQREAITSILEGQLLKKALIGTNELYKIKIVRGIESSEYPVQPNILFLVSLFTVFGLLISTMYFILTSYISNESNASTN